MRRFVSMLQTPGLEEFAFFSGPREVARFTLFLESGELVLFGRVSGSMSDQAVFYDRLSEFVFDRELIVWAECAEVRAALEARGVQLMRTPFEASAAALLTGHVVPVKLSGWTFVPRKVGGQVRFRGVRQGQDGPVVTVDVTTGSLSGYSLLGEPLPLIVLDGVASDQRAFALALLAGRGQLVSI